MKYRTNDADTLGRDYDASPDPVADLAEIFAPIHSRGRDSIMGRKVA